MQEVMKFKPVRVKATTKESALEQALQMTGASIDDVMVEVLEEAEGSITLRVAPASNDSSAATAIESSTTAATKTAADVAENVNADISDDVANDIVEGVTENSTENIEDTAEDEEEASSLAASPATAKAQESASAAARDLLQRMGLDVVVALGEAPENAAMITPSPAESSNGDKNSTTQKLPRIFLDIEGEDVGILIGKHGQTLRAFQYLLNLTLNNRKDTEGLYVTVDAGNYRSRRAESIEKSVHDAMERVRHEHRAVRLEPMPAHERRLVHLLLQEEKDLVTSSEGREPWRRVVITTQGMRSSRSTNYSRQRAERHQRGGR